MEMVQMSIWLFINEKKSIPHTVGPFT